MTKNIRLSIPRPCAEKWENFTPTYRGGFCSSCKKEVVDFTLLCDQELIDYFAKNQATTCGRFRVNQVGNSLASRSPVLTPGFRLFKAGVITLTLFLLSKPPAAQATQIKPVTEVVESETSGNEVTNSMNATYKVKGIVISEEDNLPLPGVNVVLQGSTVGTVTDADGKFEFPQPLNEGDILIFSFIGLSSEVYTVRKQVNETIEIKMNMEMDIMGEVMVSGVYSAPSTGLQKVWTKVKGFF